MKKVRVYFNPVEVTDILLMIMIVTVAAFGKIDFVIAIGFIALMKRFSG